MAFTVTPGREKLNRVGAGAALADQTEEGLLPALHQLPVPVIASTTVKAIADLAAIAPR